MKISQISKVKYSFLKGSNELTIRADILMSQMLRVILGLSFILYCIFALTIVSFSVFENTEFWNSIYNMFRNTTLVFIPILIIIARFRLHQRLIVDKLSGLIEQPYSKNSNHIHTKDLVDIDLVETTSPSSIIKFNPEGKSFRLKFKLTSGEKEINFPIDSKERGEEIIRLIKSYL